MNSSNNNKLEFKSFFSKQALIGLAICLLFTIYILCVNQNQNEHLLKKKSKFSSLKRHSLTPKTVQVKKPQVDQKEYQIFELENGLRTLLVSSNYFPSGFGVSLTIEGVGSSQDPEYGQGLSHFVEHLVFRGSKNFGFVHGLVEKSSLLNVAINGMTMDNDTAYPVVGFNITDIEDIFNRIVDFMANPELDIESVKKEIWAVTGEYRIDLHEGGQNVYRGVLKSLARKDHPFAQFDIGDVNSLKYVIENPDKILEYIRTHYVPSNMYAVIYVPNSIQEQTKQKVSEILQKIPSRPKPDFQKVDFFAFEPANKGLFAQVQQNSGVREIIVNFDVPTFYNRSEDSKSVQFVQFMVDSFNDDNFCRKMSHLGYSVGCGVGGGDQQDFLSEIETLLSFDIQLTQLGFEHISEILEYLEAYIENAKRNSIHREVYDILKDNSAYEFEWKMDEDAFDAVTELGINFREQPNQNVIFGPYNFQKYEKHEIKAIFKHLDFKNAIIIVRANDYDSVKTFDETYEFNRFLYAPLAKNENSFIENPTYYLEFEKLQLSEQDYNKLIKNARLLRNKISENFFISPFRLPVDSLKEPTTPPEHYRPTLVYFDNQTKQSYQLFHESSYNFDLGLTIFNLKSITPEHTKETISMDFLARYINKQIGIDCLQANGQGMTLSAASTTPIVRNIVQNYFPSFLKKDLEIEEKSLERIKEQALISMEAELEDGYLISEAYEALHNILIVQNDAYLNRQSIKQYIQKLNPSDLLEANHQFLSDFQVNCFIGGNFDNQTADNIFFNFFENLRNNSFPANNLTNPMNPQPLITRNFDSQYIIYNALSNFADFNNRAIINFYQFESQATDPVKEQAIIKFLSNTFGAEAFEFLRSYNMVGYVANANIKQIGEGQYVVLVSCQGFRLQTFEMDLLIEQFLQYMQQYVSEIKQQDINKFFENEIEYYQARNNNTDHRYVNVWEQLFTVYNQFSDYDPNDPVQNQTRLTVEQIPQQQDFVDSYQQWLKNGNNQVSIQLDNQFIDKQPWTENKELLQKNIPQPYSQFIQKDSVQVFNSVQDFIKNSQDHPKNTPFQI